MNREEILAKSRNENKDEGMIAAENRGREIGMAAFTIVFIFIAFFNFFHGQDNNTISALFWIFLAAESFPKYQFTKNKIYLVTTIAGALTCILSLVNYVLEILG